MFHCCRRKLRAEIDDRQHVPEGAHETFSGEGCLQGHLDDNRIAHDERREAGVDRHEEGVAVRGESISEEPLGEKSGGTYILQLM